MLIITFLLAQDTAGATLLSLLHRTIGGMPASTFYMMTVIIFLEWWLLSSAYEYQVLLKAEKAKVISEAEPED